MKSPFDAKISEALLNLAETLCEDEFRAALHLAASFAALAPTRDRAHELIDLIFDESDADVAAILSAH